MSSPTSRSLQYLRKLGIPCEKVEHWNPYSKTRHDLFGFIDIIALIDDKTVGIQATVTAKMQVREDKIRSLGRFRDWTRAHNGVLIHGWSKRGPRGKRKTWQLTVRDVEANQRE